MKNLDEFKPTENYNKVYLEHLGNIPNDLEESNIFQDSSELVSQERLSPLQKQTGWWVLLDTSPPESKYRTWLNVCRSPSRTLASIQEEFKIEFTQVRVCSHDNYNYRALDKNNNFYFVFKQKSTDKWEDNNE